MSLSNAPSPVVTSRTRPLGGSPGAKLTLVSLFALTLAACGGGGGSSDTATPAPAPAPAPGPVAPAPAPGAPSPAPSPAPAAAPTITTQPAAQSVTAPAAATFSVVATGSPAPTYQWQVSTDAGVTFVAISGATSASYTTAATSAASNGTQYRVVVANGTLPNVTSQAALLTVSTAAAVGVGSASACVNPQAFSAGATNSVTYQSTSTQGTSTLAVATRINGTATFQGTAATESEATATTTLAGSTTSSTDDVKSYLNFDPSTYVLTLYGSTSTQSGVTTVNSPPTVDRRYTLDPGASTTVRTVSTTSGFTSDVSTVETFVAVESLTVVAGTYKACKYTETSSVAGSTPTTYWLLFGNGTLLKSVSGSTSFEARSILVNGVAP